MGLEREVAGIDEVDNGTGNIAPECISTRWQEKGIVLSPYRYPGFLTDPLAKSRPSWRN
jgi:hypothetical protein